MPVDARGPMSSRLSSELAMAVLHQYIRHLIEADASGHRGYQGAGEFVMGQSSSRPAAAVWMVMQDLMRRFAAQHECWPRCHRAEKGC
jgi:hypothetical protein